MKKEQFKEICRAKAKEPLTPAEDSFFDSMGEAIELAFTAEKTERSKQLAEIQTKLGTTDDGKSIAEIIRTLATSIDAIEAKNDRTTLNDREKLALRKVLEDNKETISKSRKKDG
jgi:hypothetical protein